MYINALLFMHGVLFFPILTGQLQLTQSSLPSEAKLKIQPVAVQALKSRASPQWAQELQSSICEPHTKQSWLEQTIMARTVWVVFWSSKQNWMEAAITYQMSRLEKGTLRQGWWLDRPVFPGYSHYHDWLYTAQYLIV